MKKQLTELQQTNTQLFDQNILLKAQLAAATNGTSSGAHHASGPSNSVSSTTEMEFYKAENSRLNQEIDNLNSKLNDALDMTEKSLSLTEIGRLRKDQEDLLELLTDQVGIHFELKRCLSLILLKRGFSFFHRTTKLRNIVSGSSMRIMK